MKRWQIVYGLPLEVWMDIFCFRWISREKFGQLVDRIGNFKFAENAQFYLHEWGNQKMGNLDFDKDGLCKYVCVNGKLDRLGLEYPQTPMPENIKSFNTITIDDLDIVLGYIQPKNPGELENIRTILTILTPMLGEIQSVFCEDASTLSAVKNQLFQDTSKLAKLKWLDVLYDKSTGSETDKEQQENVTFIMNLLAQPDNGWPRRLEFRSENDFFKQIYKAIRQQFLVATTPRTFAVDLKLYSWEERQAAEFHLENGIGEALHGEWIGDEEDYDEDEGELFQITRHCADYNTDQEREWIEGKTKERRCRTIQIYHPTIGAIDAAVAEVDMPPMDEDEKKQAEQQPCSSKDA